MTDVALVKGGNAVLPAYAFTAAHVDAVLEWRNSAGPEGVDLSAILVTSSGQVRSDADLVFFNQSSSADGSVGHLGKQSAGGRTRDAVRVWLPSVSGDVTSVFIAASIDGDGTFSDVDDLRLMLLDAAGQLLVALRPRPSHHGTRHLGR